MIRNLAERGLEVEERRREVVPVPELPKTATSRAKMVAPVVG